MFMMIIRVSASRQLQLCGFEVDFIQQDGGQQKSGFMKLHFEDAVDKGNKYPSLRTNLTE